MKLPSLHDDWGMIDGKTQRVVRTTHAPSHVALIISLY
jgi:hypothetical protein